MFGELLDAQIYNNCCALRVGILSFRDVRDNDSRLDDMEKDSPITSGPPTFAVAGNSGGGSAGAAAVPPMAAASSSPSNTRKSNSGKPPAAVGSEEYNKTLESWSMPQSSMPATF